MKLSPEAMLVLVDAFRRAISEGIDISDVMRGLDLVPDARGLLVPVSNSLLGPSNKG